MVLDFELSPSISEKYLHVRRQMSVHVFPFTLLRDVQVLRLNPEGISIWLKIFVFFFPQDSLLMFVACWKLDDGFQ